MQREIQRSYTKLPLQDQNCPEFNDVVVGRVVFKFVPKVGGWVLPGGRVVMQQEEAVAIAERLNKRI